MYGSLLGLYAIPNMDNYKSTSFHIKFGTVSFLSGKDSLKMASLNLMSLSHINFLKNHLLSFLSHLCSILLFVKMGSLILEVWWLKNGNMKIRICFTIYFRVCRKCFMIKVNWKSDIRLTLMQLKCYHWNPILLFNEHFNQYSYRNKIFTTMSLAPAW